jgi:antitoxin (DNA-binding transcriptional repressor) of toxin-antitoxin stability system
MVKIIGLREFRENTERYIKAIKIKGDSFVVLKRSKPVFKITKATHEDAEWERVIDFTKFRKNGVSAKKLLAKL